MSKKTLLAIILLSSVLLPRICAEPCGYRHGFPDLNLVLLDAQCGSTTTLDPSSFGCEKAIDSDPNTAWIPVPSQSAPQYSLVLPRPVTMVVVRILQRKWTLGRATRLRITLGDAGAQWSWDFRARQDAYHAWEEFVLPHPVHTHKLLITVIEVKPMYFGGLVEVAIAGCESRTLNDGGHEQETEAIVELQEAVAEDSSTEGLLDEPAKLGSVIGAATGALFLFVLMGLITVTLCSGGGSRAFTPAPHDDDDDDDSHHDEDICNCSSCDDDRQSQDIAVDNGSHHPSECSTKMTVVQPAGHHKSLPELPN